VCGEWDSCGYRLSIRILQKWLKDRKSHKLTDEDIDHYQKIVAALAETIRIMEEIDAVIEEHGGFPIQ
jgi:hypothetical protein